MAHKANKAKQQGREKYKSEKRLAKNKIKHISQEIVKLGKRLEYWKGKK